MATIKDVTREAGFAVGTASRVLNNRGYISDSAGKPELQKRSGSMGFPALVITYY